MALTLLWPIIKGQWINNSTRRYEVSQSLWGGFPWFNVHEDRQGLYVLIYCSPHRTGKCGTRPFLVGPSAGPEPTHAQHCQKYFLSRSRFTLLGAPRALGNERGKSLGDGPLTPEEISSCRDTLARSVLQSARPAEVRTNNWRSAVLLQLLLPPSTSLVLD